MGFVAGSTVSTNVVDMITMGNGASSRISSENTIEIAPLVEITNLAATAPSILDVYMYSTVRGLISPKVRKSLSTPGQVLSFQFPTITLSSEEEIYWTLLPGTAVVSNTYSSWSVTIAGSTAAVSQQSWPEYNITTLGLIPEIVSTQEEFYNGEYSGSAVNALVTQSNPYKSVLPSETMVYSKNIINPSFSNAVTGVTPQTNPPLTVITGDGFSFDQASGTTNIFRLSSTKIRPFQKYNVSLRLTSAVGAGSIGILTENYNPTTNTLYSPSSQNGVPSNSITSNGTLSLSFTFTPPPEEWDNVNKLYSIGFTIQGELSGIIDLVTIVGEGGIYEETQGLIPWDLNVINNYNINTKGFFNIYNTQSLIFENSDYNPLNNNAEYSRRSTNHYQLEYGGGYGGPARPLIKSQELLPIVGINYPLGGPAGTPILVTVSSIFAGGIQQTGAGATFTITSDGVNASSVVVTSPGANYVVGNIIVIDETDLQAAGFTSAVGPGMTIGGLTTNYLDFQSPHTFTSQTPSNLESIIGVMYNPLSSSAKATVPDSNYTQISTLNPTYRGSKIQSLDYNNYTPSGSVGVIKSLPPTPNNQNQSNVSYSVADNFLDGSTKFWETDDSQSWGGDNVDNRLTAVIDKHPQYIAHFERSFEQTNYYNSREFQIDSLISISMDNLSGQEITPVSIAINGTNAYKKWISSIFEPNRGVGVSYTTAINSIDPSAIYLETSVGSSYDLLGGSIQFLTLNANAKSRNASSNAYFYTIGDLNVAEIALTGQLTGSTNQATAGGGIIQSGSSLSQGTLGVPILQTSLNGVGGTAYPIVQDGIVVNVLFSSSLTVGSADFARGYQSGEEITFNRTYLTSQGYGTSPSNVTIILPEANIHNSETTQLNQDLNAIQMVTASHITDEGLQYGFLLSGSATTSSVDNGTNFLLPFSQNQERSGFAGLPESSKLSIGGPQLALFHTYNQLVASQSIRPALTCPVAPPAVTYISQSPVWVLEGIDPASEDSYYQWVPSSSDCPFYEDNREAFLIERGDVLRVEGIKSLLTDTLDVTSSIEFVEDFTVAEVQNFNYSSSAVVSPPGTLIANSSPITIAPLVSVSTRGLQGYVMTDLTSGPTPPTALNFTFTTDNPAASGGTVYLQVNQSGPSDTGEYWISADGVYIQSGVGSSNYVPGDTITISAADLNLEFNNLNVTDDLVITLNGNMIVGGIGNNFTVLTDLDPGCLNPDDSNNPYGQGYIQYDQGDIGLILPTFLKTDRNPSVVLEGLQAGAVTKFTLIRQVENEQKIMIKNLPASKGSKGFLTQTGGGYLIPDDLSLTQQENALNIINQLRQKNAVPTPK